jgi:hypothetical protein
VTGYERIGIEPVAYTYDADLLCPSCVITALPTGPGARFDGWKDMSVPPMSAEANLTELAVAFGIDRTNEDSFDSSEFPKVVFSTEPGDYCAGCLIEL